MAAMSLWMDRWKSSRPGGETQNGEQKEPMELGTQESASQIYHLIIWTNAGQIRLFWILSFPFYKNMDLNIYFTRIFEKRIHVNEGA